MLYRRRAAGSGMGANPPLIPTPVPPLLNIEERGPHSKHPCETEEERLGEHA
jgi:hypothetical protein